MYIQIENSIQISRCLQILFVLFLYFIASSKSQKCFSTYRHNISKSHNDGNKFYGFYFHPVGQINILSSLWFVELDDDKKLHSLARDVSGRMSIWGGQHRQARKNFMNLHYLCIRLNLEYHKNEQSLPCSFYKSNVVNLLKIPHQGLASKGFVSSYVAFSARNKNMISYFTLWLPYFMLWGNVKSVRKLMLRYHNGNERMKMVSGVYLVSVMLILKPRYIQETSRPTDHHDSVSVGWLCVTIAGGGQTPDTSSGSTFP